MGLRQVLQLVYGTATYIPAVHRLRERRAGGTQSARYCYSVWLRHLVMAYRHGLLEKPPAVVAELGPGDSLGTLLAALISGSQRGYAFDVVQFAQNTRNVEVFDQLVTLFRQREAIPREDEFPRVHPQLESYEFPSDILPPAHLDEALDKPRLEALRNTLLNLGVEADPSACITYAVPWHDSRVLEDAQVGMVYSQAVLEHVDNLPETYAACARWLKPGGIMSHRIGFQSHGLADKWNGYWAYSDLRWKLVRGRRTYLLNRQPHSRHVELLAEYNFELVCDLTVHDHTGIGREALAVAFRGISDDDLVTLGAFMQARKK